jgi:glycosyltransferase involved in cell wall biosynthesis
MVPRVSVIVPTYRREARLRRTLADVSKLRWPELEVILVDQTERHEPETTALLQSLRDRVRHVRHAPPGVVPAVNRGLALARGDIALLLDDDIAIDDGELVAHHVANYADPSVGAVAGRVFDADDPREGRHDARCADPVWGFFHSRWDHGVRGEVTTAPGANMSVRRQLVVGLGGLDERLRSHGFRWENDLCLTLRAAGFRTVYDPRPAVLHFYASPGGAENRHLLGREHASHAWYHDFFHNHAYVALKHFPASAMPVLLWRLYRAHVLNRPYLREGPRFVLRRHRAFVSGVAAAGVSRFRARAGAAAHGAARILTRPPTGRAGRARPI